MLKLSVKSWLPWTALITSLCCAVLANAVAQESQSSAPSQISEADTRSPQPKKAEHDTQKNLSLDQQLQQLKKEVISLNRDLFVLEEDLLFPSSTQVVIYLSMDVGTYFDLDAVELKIDGRTVTHYLYTDKQTSALYRGGVQRLHVDNLAQGEHQISAFFTGTGPQDRPYKRATSFTFTKQGDAKALQLSIVDSSTKQQPEFTVVEL